ncbi:MAG: PAS domain S-box protein, partial [Actinomycetes bacterium]
MEESEHHYRLLAENATDVVLVTDEQMVAQWVSPSITSAFGWAPDQLQGRPATRFIHHEDAAALRDDVAGAAPGQQVCRRIRGWHADGDYRWTLGRGRLVTDTDGANSGRFLGVQDIHEQVATGNEVADSERKYRLIADNATDLVFLVDLAGMFAWVSPAAKRVLGYHPDDLIGTAMRDLVHSEELALFDSFESATDREPYVVRFEIRLLAADGEYRWISGIVHRVPDAADAAASRIVALRDIQEQVLTQQELARRGEQLEQAKAELEVENERRELVLAGTRLGLWDWNLLTGEFLIDERLARMLGYDLADLQPVTLDTLDRLSHPDDLSGDHEFIERVRNGQATECDREVRMRHRDGRWRWIRTRGTVVARTPDGQPSRMTGTHEDVTDLVEARVALAESERRYRGLVDALPDATYVLRAVRDEHDVVIDLAYTHVNTAGEALYSRAGSEILGHTILELFPSVATLGVFGFYTHTLITKQPGHLTVPDFDENGVTASLDLTAVPFGDEIVVTARDVTTALVAQQRLARSENRYRLLAENATDVVWQLDPSSVMVWA